jgi:hypothetical protein
VYPDPDRIRIFWASRIRHYLYRSGSFHQQAKKEKPWFLLFSTSFWLSVLDEVTVPSKSIGQKNFEKITYFLLASCHLDKKSRIRRRIPKSVVRICTKMLRIRNTESKIPRTTMIQHRSCRQALWPLTNRNRCRCWQTYRVTWLAGFSCW